MKGVSLKAVAELLGYQDITMRLRYAHLSPAQLSDAVDRLCTIFSHKDFSESRPSVSTEHQSTGG